jgi:prepilin-type processing-associated H-X9-DG protein
MYDNEAKGGLFPPAGGFWTYYGDISGRALFPEYWNDLAISYCPSSTFDPDTLGYAGLNIKDIESKCDGLTYQSVMGYARSYFYFNWAMPSVEYFLMAWVGWLAPAGGMTFPPSSIIQIPWNCSDTTLAALGGDPWYGKAANWDWDMTSGNLNTYGGPGASAWFDAFLPALAGTAGRDLSTIYRLREGIERFFITDINNPAGAATAQSTIPIMMDNWNTSLNDTGGGISLSTFNHVPGGSNVLYADGHVSWVRMGDGYPVPKADVYNPTDWGSPASYGWMMGDAMGMLIGANK